MKRTKNPFSTRWDPPIHPDRITGEDVLLYNAFEMIQAALYYEGILIEMDLAMYLPALEAWGEKYPNYLVILLNLAIQASADIEQKGELPPFVTEFFLTVFTQLDVMVNGETINNLEYLSRFR